MTLVLGSCSTDLGDKNISSSIANSNNGLITLSDTNLVQAGGLNPTKIALTISGDAVTTPACLNQMKAINSNGSDQTLQTNVFAYDTYQSTQDKIFFTGSTPAACNGLTLNLDIRYKIGDQSYFGNYSEVIS